MSDTPRTDATNHNFPCMLSLACELERELAIEREAAGFSFDHKKHILEQLSDITLKHQVACDTVARQLNDNEKLTGYIHAIDGAKDKKIAELEATIARMKKLPSVPANWGDLGREQDTHHPTSATVRSIEGASAAAHPFGCNCAMCCPYEFAPAADTPTGSPS